MGCLSFLIVCNRHRSRPGFKWIPKFLSCQGGPGYAPSEIFENQVSQIGGNWITDYLFWRYFYFSFSHKLLLQLEMFSKHITPIVLNFHCQRHFDDCLNISVLGRFDRNYEPGSVLNCALKLCAFFQKDLKYESNRILRSSLYFQTLWSKSFKLWPSIELIMK